LNIYKNGVECQEETAKYGNASVIRGGDSAGALRKLYTCLRVAASAKAGRKLLNTICLGWKFLKGLFFRDGDDGS
jgi:hypothetical protein